MPGRLTALVAALLLALSAVAATGCGGDGDDGGSGDVPSGAVATVGDAEISEQDLDQQVAALRRVQGKAGSPARGDQAAQLRKQLRAQALALLLMRQAIEQEAAERDIEVTPAEARRRWESASSSQFKTRRALRRFLRGQTEREVVDQLRLQMLSEQIAEQVAEQAGGGKAGAKAVREFQEGFQKRWQERTACREGLTVSGCPANDSASSQ